MSDCGSSTSRTSQGSVMLNGNSYLTQSENGVGVQPKIQKIAYHHRTFADFCALVVRMFYDDGCIVLLDFLVTEKRAFTEADIRERLKWKDNLLHQKLYFLERQLLVQKEQNFEKGSKSPVYWRVSPHIVIAVEWHFNKLISEIRNQVDASHSLHEFECPVCQLKYSALDVASGMRAIDDDHPLCKKCGQRLCTSDSEEAKQEIKGKQERAVQQLATLRQSFNRVKNMETPVFEKYTRADKNEQKRELEKTMNKDKSSASSSLVGSSAGGAPPEPSSQSKSSTTGGLPSMSDAGDEGLRPNAAGPFSSSLGPSAAGTTGVGTFSLSIASSDSPQKQQDTNAANVKRVIPWFNIGQR